MNFENAQERFCVCTYPFLSMLSSLLNEYGYVFDFSLNFVNLSQISSVKLCELFQIFNREKIVLNNLSLTTKNLDNILATIKDEVFVVDSTAYEEATDYQKNTNYQKLVHLLAIFNEQRYLPTANRRVHAGLVTISSSYCLRNNVHNMIFSPNPKLFENNGLMSSHCMERIFYNFINFIENMTDTEKIEFFSKRRIERSNSGRVLSLIFDLLTAFWSKYGLDFSSELMFPTFDFDTFFDLGEREDGNEEINKFIAILRKHALNYTIAEKKRSCVPDNCILFTEEYVFIPVNIVKSICNNENISTEHRRILLEMRKQGLLKTDKNSLSRIVQINNQRHEMYVFKREALTRPGEIDFIHLGKAVQ